MPTEDEVKKAEELLGVSRYDEMKTIIKKYRLLIKENHPDKGGVDKKAGNINTALDALKEFKKSGVKVIHNPGVKDCTKDVFIHPIYQNPSSSSQNNNVNSVFEDLQDILKERLKVRESNLNRANVAAKQAVKMAGDNLSKKIVKIGANLLADYFLKGDVKDFKKVVIKTLKKELKSIKKDLSEEIKEGILKYFNNLFGLELNLEDLSDKPKKKDKRKSRKSKKKCKIHTIEGGANKLDLKRLINKGCAKISCSVKSSKGYYINKRLELYYIEKIYKKDTVLVICRDSNNKIYKILAE